MKTIALWARRVIATTTLAVAALGGSVQSAHAACLSAELWYEIDLLSSTREYVIGPQECLLSTPWPVRQGAQRTVTVLGNDIGVGVWIPSPVAEPRLCLPLDCPA